MTGRVMAAMLGCAVAVLAGQKASAQDLAPTPPMGWNSWNTFQTHIDEDLIKSTADTMIASGMRDAGYVYVNLDDGWSAKESRRRRQPRRRSAAVSRRHEARGITSTPTALNSESITAPARKPARDIPAPAATNFRMPRPTPPGESII